MPKGNIFVSHATSTDIWTFDFVETLRDADYKVWFDQTDWYRKGGFRLIDLKEILRTQIQKADHIVFIITPAFAASDAAKFELLSVDSLKKAFLYYVRKSGFLNLSVAKDFLMLWE